MNIKRSKINTNINGIVSDIDHLNIESSNLDFNFKGDKINIPDINLRKSGLNKSIEENIFNKNDIKDSNNLETEEEKIDRDIYLSKNKLESNNDYENKSEFNMSIDREIKRNDNDIKINCLKNSSEGDESDKKSKNKNNSIKSKTINIIIGYNLSQNLSNKNIFLSKIRGKKSEDILPKEVINFINPEMPPNLPNIKINAPKKEDSLNNYLYHEETHNLPNINNNHLGRESLNKELYSNINPEGPNSEIYKKNILLGQKILIVMLYNDISVNINKLFYNEENKTVKDAVSHFGIEIIAVNNYIDAIKELTKDENGKYPYYACWLLNSSSITPETNQFLDILVKFWKNGGAVVLFSDNTPFIEETNLFLLKINANFIMEGNYIGQKDIYGDDTGLLNKPALFNRNKSCYKYKTIQRQGLCHNLYSIYEGVTISSVSKDNKRKMNVIQDDIKPFIPFARDSEGGITSLIKLANDYGEGDLIIDGGFTKLFINMKESGTFRYIQNIAGFTARPEIHLLNNILPKDYRPKKVSL